MKESNNIYELLNEMDFNIEDYEKEELNDIEKQNLKKAFRNSAKKKFNLKKFGSIAAVLVLSIGVLSQTDFGKNVYAAAESKVSEISYSIGKALGIERNIEPYANVVGKVKEDNGIEVKLEQVIIDKDTLTFNAVFNTTKPVEGASFENIDFFINGKRVNYSLGSGSSGPLDDTNTLFYSLCHYTFKGIEQMEDIEIKLVLKDLHYYIGESKDIEETEKGKWEFEFTANGKELALETKSSSIDYTFNIDNQRYKLNELEYNPVRQTIKGKREIVGEYKDSHRIELRGHDNLGNEIIFFIKSATQDEVIFSYERNYGFLGDWSDEITFITLAPVTWDSVDYKQIGEEFTIYIDK